MSQRILVVEDEPAIAESVAYALGRDGFLVTLAATVTDAAALVDGADLVILDLMLPDGSGFDLIGRWRKNKHIAIARPAATAKPIAWWRSSRRRRLRYQALLPREVVARVRAVLRRSQTSWHRGLPSAIHWMRRRVAARQRLDLELTRVEFDVLAVPARAARPSVQPGRADRPRLG